MKRICTLVSLLAVVFSAFSFDYNAGRASLSPYPSVESVVACPDSLQPFFINHVGRHGSRYPAGSLHTKLMKMTLEDAAAKQTITDLGRDFLAEVDRVLTATGNRWGQLDTIGEQEHRGIARRMYKAYPDLFAEGTVRAVSSYSPRSIMSMYSFTHELTQQSSAISVETASGRQFNTLVRNFDIDEEYKAYRNDTAYAGAYGCYLAQNLTVEPLLRLVGENYELDYETISDLALAEYYVAAGMNAMGLEFDASKYFTLEEYKRLWSIFNFRQYLLYSASVVSSRPAEIAGPLLQDIVMTADSVINGKLDIRAKLRFGHAETLMPLMALIQAPGCYYLSNYFDSVADNWKDYEQFPMAANLQLIYFRGPSGKVYVRVDYNEKPIRLLPGQTSDYVEWSKLRSRFLELLPLY